MVAAGTYKVNVSVVMRRNGLADFDQRVRDSLEEATREAARGILEAEQERVRTQAIPGPPLEPQTIAREAAILRRLNKPVDAASKKWTWLGLMSEKEFILTRRTLRRAVADIMTAPGTDIHTYRLLELGGVNDEGKVIPSRPLWTTVVRQDKDTYINRFIEVLRRRLGVL